MSQSATIECEPRESPSTAASEHEELTCDEVFEILNNRRRRYTLYYLEQNGAETTLGTLATQIAAWESDQPPQAVTADERRRVYTSLQQFHLPKLHEKGLVTFDDGSGLVERNDAADEVSDLLEKSADPEIPWSMYYLGVVGLGAALVSLAWLGIPPFAAVSNTVWIALLLVMFAVSALTQAVLARRGPADSPVPPDVGQ